MVPRRLRAAVLMVGALTLLLGGTALLYGEAARAAENYTAAAARAAGGALAPPEQFLEMAAAGPPQQHQQQQPDAAALERLAAQLAPVLESQQRVTLSSARYTDADGGGALPVRAAAALPPMPTVPSWRQRTEVLVDAGDRAAGLAPLHGLWSPTEVPRGVLIVVGGTSAGVAGPCRGTHRVTARGHGLYNLLASVLPASEGVSVLQLSYRSLGWEGLDQSRKDLNAALRWVSSDAAHPRRPRVPIGLIGHSMGSAVRLPRISC